MQTELQEEPKKKKKMIMLGRHGADIFLLFTGHDFDDVFEVEPPSMTTPTIMEVSTIDHFLEVSDSDEAASDDDSAPILLDVLVNSIDHG